MKDANRVDPAVRSDNLRDQRGGPHRAGAETDAESTCWTGLLRIGTVPSSSAGIFTGATHPC